MGSLLPSSEGERETQSPTMHRSTSRASKQRRELIKTEIDRLRELLPLPGAVKARLSFLHVMSLACVYVRKGHYFNQEQEVVSPVSRWDDISPFDFTQALHGFLLVMTRQGKLLYISENVTDYLGHSMVELLSTGGDLYEVIDPRDHAVVRGQMTVAPGSAAAGDADYQSDVERTFFCRMNTSRNMRRKDHCTDNKMVRIKGRFRILWSGCCYSWGQAEAVFTAVCSPVETLTPISDEMAPLKTSMFSTEHGMDMTVYDASSNVYFHLGYEASEICGLSWYTLVHPDYHETARKHHQQMLQPSLGTAASRCAFVLRLLRKDSGWVTVSVTAWLDRDSTVNHAAVIMCQNLVIREDEIPMYESQALHESLARRSSSCLVSPSPASASTGSSGERFGCGLADEARCCQPGDGLTGSAPCPLPGDASPDAYGRAYASGSNDDGGDDGARRLRSLMGVYRPSELLQQEGTGNIYAGECGDRGGEWRYDVGYCNYRGVPQAMTEGSRGWDSAGHDAVGRGSCYGPYSSVLVGPVVGGRHSQLLPACSRKERLADGLELGCSLASAGALHHGGHQQQQQSAVAGPALSSDPCPALKRAVLEWARRLKAKRQVVGTAGHGPKSLAEPRLSDCRERARKRAHHREAAFPLPPAPYKAEADYAQCAGGYQGFPSKRRALQPPESELPSDPPPPPLPYHHHPHRQTHVVTEPEPGTAIGTPGSDRREDGQTATWFKLPQYEGVWWCDSGAGWVSQPAPPPPPPPPPQQRPVSVPDSILTPECSPAREGETSEGPSEASAGRGSASPETERAAGPRAPTLQGERAPPSIASSDGEGEPVVGTLEAAVGKALCALSSDELRLLDQATLSLMYHHHQSASTHTPPAGRHHQAFPRRTTLSNGAPK